MRAQRGPGADCPSRTGLMPLPEGKPRRKDVVTRSKSWIAIVAIIVVATALAAVALPQKAEATSLKGKLRTAKQALRHSTHRLKAAEAALAAAVATATTTGATVTDPAAMPTPADTSTPAATPAASAVDQLKAQVEQARRAVHLWKQRVHRIAKQYRFQLKMARWEAHKQWMPIIKVAAAKYHVKADGMYRMMMRESGGQPYAGSSSSYKGLFQYYTGTWASSWNPWRGDNIYDGSSQIFATAYAISKGMGPSMWTTTYSSQY